MLLIENFSLISGLKINYSKTVAVKIHMNEQHNFTFKADKEITWQNLGKFTLLGIRYDLDQENFTDINYDLKLKEFENILNLWQTRNLTMYGKICIIKSLALSKLIHLFSSLPNPNDDFFKKMDKIAFNFVWNGKTERIKRTTMSNTYKNGDLKCQFFTYFVRRRNLYG